MAFVVLPVRRVRRLELQKLPPTTQAQAQHPLAGTRHERLSKAYSWTILLASGQNNHDDKAHQSEQQRTEKPQKPMSSYNTSDGASKGLVSSLTGLVNWFSDDKKKDMMAAMRPQQQQQKSPIVTNGILPTPTSPMELFERIRQDYTRNNYLWTGQLDMGCFEESCRFTDPTISFQGTDTFVRNTQNLVPLVESYCTNTQSILLNATLSDQYVETRWNMVGSLTGGIFRYWQPQINVIGRTKFWYRRQDGQGEEEEENEDGSSSDRVDDSDNGRPLKVYFYDEAWEIPAFQALLQLVTPAGTIPNTSSKLS
jgi:hypothetical protein